MDNIQLALVVANIAVSGPVVHTVGWWPKWSTPTSCASVLVHCHGNACPVQVAEQVGEVLVHCRYGCQPKPDAPDEYEVASGGCPVVVKMNQRQ